MVKQRPNPKKDRILDVLYGGKIPKKVPEIAHRMVDCLYDPKVMYIHIEDIINYPKIEEMRIHLARVQMDSELHMRDDVDYNTRKLWAAQTIERMVFGGLMVDGEKISDEDDNEE